MRNSGAMVGLSVCMAASRGAPMTRWVSDNPVGCRDLQEISDVSDTVRFVFDRGLHDKLVAQVYQARGFDAAESASAAKYAGFAA